jgi:catechol 2,3-dioxygenase-like lactoylglutathione lyase family enzyme
MEAAYPVLREVLEAPRRERRRRVARIVGSVLALLAWAGTLVAFSPDERTDERGGAARPDPAESAGPAVAAVESIGFTVADLDRSVAFFRDVLTFELVETREEAGDAFEHLVGVFGARARIARMRLGEEEIELTEFLAPRGRPYPEGTRANDRWFQHFAIVTSDMPAAYARLREHRVEHASTGPQKLPEWNMNAAGIEAFYFRDPDGHFLEVIHFPPGKGDPRWQQATASADVAPRFLGIDHTAIVVADTESSLAFYRDRLGLKVAGASENFGVEQEHLNNVFGARLRITTLRAARGPGIELLDYLTPRDGRPVSLDLKPNDLAHWQTRLSAPSLDSAADALLHDRVAFVSPGLIRGATPTAPSACLLRDPDGHGLLLVEP